MSSGSSNISSYGANLNCGSFKTYVSIQNTSQPIPIETLNLAYKCGVYYSASQTDDAQSLDIPTNLLANSSQFTVPSPVIANSSYFGYQCNANSSSNYSYYSSLESGANNNPFPYVDIYECGQNFFADYPGKHNTEESSGVSLKQENSLILSFVSLLVLSSLFI
ncbi:hypothetical protein DASC09_040710 [Saccharomycopsis crataegensis]|uniref:Uncharacterized protein n=1 Tax=Saccharomycopsis crataegensis TaxID=43959 RepID=A0AAV5QPV7_9ASCO|nr:hypothetical protein DASC09_040710 [Saccharomycopsis crataegensis]